MAKKFLGKNPVNWRELVSPQVFKLDIVDGFKYRLKQSLFFLFSTMVLFALLAWGFSYDLADINGNGRQLLLLILLYLPAGVGLVFWFRAGLSYDFDHWDHTNKKKPKTKKSLQAAWVFRVTIVLFGIYYAYWMYRLWQLSQH